MKWTVGSVTTALALASASAATATTVQVTPQSPTVVEETATRVDISGTFDGEPTFGSLYSWELYTKTDDGNCNPTPGSNSNATRRHFGFEYTGAFAGTTSVTFDEPGQYLLCGYTDTYTTATATSIAARSLTVRNNSATVSLQALHKMRTGRKLRVSYNGTTEVPRNLYVAVKRIGQGGRCARSYDQEQADDLIYEASLDEENRVRDGFNGALLSNRIKRPGRYAVCAWIAEHIGDAAPEASANTTVLVKRKLHRH